ncbi:fucolectin-4-like isoform X2 [Haliotis rubra]|uniref:fucolectin-4-like isoform X2 n=1 Tax=Haliotis rubra TaxID=36100 RepID=UPI001EE5905C|nr:fucolectin-4-like isoform X2 [Haliotis rubra]
MMELFHACFLFFAIYLTRMKHVYAFSNVALYKPASMDSFRDIYPPSAAVDGDSTTAIHTDTVSVPFHWWEVDLLNSYTITTVTVTSRDCCPGRFRNFTIDLTSDHQTSAPVTQLCHYYPGSFARFVTSTIACDETLTARKVKVTMDSSDDRPLDINEVKVKGLHVCGNYWLQFTLNAGVKRSESPLLQTDVESRQACSHRCRENIACDAFQTLTSSSSVTCQLFTGRSGATISDSNWKYYSFSG